MGHRHLCIRTDDTFENTRTVRYAQFVHTFCTTQACVLYCSLLEYGTILLTARGTNVEHFACALCKMLTTMPTKNRPSACLPLAERSRPAEHDAIRWTSDSRKVRDERDDGSEFT